MLSNPHGKNLPDLALHGFRAVWALALLSPAPFAQAIGLGGYELQSWLGQPLRMVVQITARADETIETGCFRVHPFTVSDDGLPQLTGAQLALDRRGNQPRLIVTNARPVLDPVVRISIDVGCDTTLRRDLTLLLDPISVTAAQVETTDPEKPGAAPAAPAVRSTTAATADEPGRSATSGNAGPGAAPGAGVAGARSRPGGTAASTAPRASRQAGTASERRTPGTSGPPRARRPANPEAAGELRPRASKAAPQQPRDRLSISTSGPPMAPYVGAPITPHLTLSTTLTDRTGQPPLPESVLSLLRQTQARLKAAPVEEDIPSLEAELAVLQKRTAEMRSQLDAAMAQLQLLKESTGAAQTGSAPAAQPATAGSGAAATPVSSLPKEAPASPWQWLESPLVFALLLGLLLVLLLVGGVIWLRREQTESRRAARWNKTPYVPVTAPSPARPSAPSPGPDRDNKPARPGTAPPAPRPESETESFLPHSTGQAARELGVTDLAQATEKAGVFATLGRPEQAINVLRDHIEQEPRPSPMALLMLLDLYRQTGQRSEFAALSQRFHLEFNAETPGWEQATPPNEAGLAEFPRLVAKIRDDWPGPESRAYIDELLHDNRGGIRIGFSVAAFRDLLLLHGIVDEPLRAEETAPQLDPQTGAVIPPPPPPPHLAEVWAAAVAQPPDFPPASPLQLDMGLLSDSTERSALEAGYPIIAEAIMTRWGKPGLADYLGNLIRSATDDRGPNLTDETMSELIMLHDVALELGEPEPGYTVA